MSKCILVLTLLLSVRCFGQNDESAIRHTINQLFHGMRQSDTSLIRSAFSSDAVLQTIQKDKAGKTSVRSELLDSFILLVGGPHKEIFDERIVYDFIKIDGDLASAWTPYKFFLGEKFSHCGVNTYVLIKLNGQWKIHYLIDTRRRQDCE